MRLLSSSLIVQDFSDQRVVAAFAAIGIVSISPMARTRLQGAARPAGE
jgi:hypothetical protein